MQNDIPNQTKSNSYADEDICDRDLTNGKNDAKQGCLYALTTIIQFRIIMNLRT